MANDPTYDISQYTDALEDAKDNFEAAVKGKDVRRYIASQCDATIDLANAINDNLNDAVEMSLAVPDTTLTQEGKPADAKATGDALATKADKDYAVIEDRAAIGPDSLAAIFSTASGIGAVTGSANGQLAIGQFNVEDSDSEYLFIAGNGNDDNDRHNAAVIDTTGNACFAGSAYVGGADLAHGSELAPKSWVSSQGYASASALNGKVNTADVSDDIITDAASTTKVPSVKAIKDYVDGSVPSLTNYYTKSETDAAIAAAIGNAIGGSY